VVFHKVLNFIQYQYNKNLKQVQPKFVYASQYSLATLLDEVIFYDDYKGNSENQILTKELFEKKIGEQLTLGESMATRVKLLPESTFPRTTFFSKKALQSGSSYPFQERYVQFTPSDCVSS
jgi:hypothetical protein